VEPGATFDEPRIEGFAGELILAEQARGLASPAHRLVVASRPPVKLLEPTLEVREAGGCPLVVLLRAPQLCSPP
jgi:hypothetical protein